MVKIIKIWWVLIKYARIFETLLEFLTDITEKGEACSLNIQQFTFLKEGGDSCSNFTKIEKLYSKLIQFYRNLLFLDRFKKQIIQNQTNQTKLWIPWQIWLSSCLHWWLVLECIYDAVKNTKNTLMSFNGATISFSVLIM